MPIMERPDMAAMLSDTGRASLAWPELRVEYSWLPPFEGESVTKPNRLEVVFSAHPRVAVDQDGRRYTVIAEPGAGYVVGAAPTTLRRVVEHSDTLEIYPDLELMRSEAEQAGVRGFELEPTLGRERTVAFHRDPVLLAAAHRLRRVVVGRAALADIEASSLAHLLAHRVLARQHRAAAPPPARLDARTLRRVSEAVEARLGGPLTLADLAAEAGLSPFHFARCFKATTGLAPLRYVLARRIELAKRLCVTTRAPVQEIAWTAGFEKVSHFRRQFAAELGVLPGELRRATTAPARPSLEATTLARATRGGR